MRAVAIPTRTSPFRVATDHVMLTHPLTHPNKRRGFSLIETMIASALFFVGLTAIFQTYNVAARLLGHHRHVTRAVALAEGTIEELVQRYPGDPILEVGVAPTPRTYDMSGLLTSSATVFSVSWTVTNFALDGIREVIVTVSWTEQGAAKKLSIKTWRS